jgi:hypothetical protein
MRRLASALLQIVPTLHQADRTAPSPSTTLITPVMGPPGVLFTTEWQQCVLCRAVRCSEVLQLLSGCPGGSLVGQVDAMLMDLGVSSMQVRGDFESSAGSPVMCTATWVGPYQVLPRQQHRPHSTGNRHVFLSVHASAHKPSDSRLQGSDLVEFHTACLLCLLLLMLLFAGCVSWMLLSGGSALPQMAP